MKRLPVWLAIAFAVADAIWALLIYRNGDAIDGVSIEAVGKAAAGTAELVGMWNIVHFPVYLLLQPVVFASTRSDPVSPSLPVVYGYFFVEILWVALIGWLLGKLFIRVSGQGSR